jgi:hypothetical protein
MLQFSLYPPEGRREQAKKDSASYKTIQGKGQVQWEWAANQQLLRGKEQ